MKALMLAGGSGTRLRPITHTSAKQLVPVANKPVLFYGLEAIRAAGIAQAGIIVGDTQAEVRAAVGDGSAFGLSVTYIHQQAPLGLAHCVLIARRYLGDDDFVMYLGDNFIVGGITDFVAKFRKTHPAAHLLLTEVSDLTQFGVAELGTDDRVVRLAEKPSDPKGDLAVAGIYLFTPAIHEAVAAIRPGWRGELEITDALQWLIDHGGDVRAHVGSGYWKDTGRVADMLECNRIVLDTIERAIRGEVDPASEIIGRVTIEPHARVSRSRIVGPAIIGEGAVVTDTYIGAYSSIGPCCVLEHAEIEYSIVMDRSVIQNVGRISGSLIGKEVNVEHASSAPRAHQLVLGDHSSVRITP